MLTAIVGFICAFALIFFRVPIAIALAAVGFIGFLIMNGLTPAMSMMSLVTTGTTMTYHFAVIPLFILMGNLVAAAGISAELYRAAQVYVGHRRGGLAVATILSCGGFAAVSGSSVATAVTMGRISIPSMQAYGYSDRLSAATVAAGGTLGILIPPSLIMVIYGVITETHIGKLFAAGIIPGLIGIAGYTLAIQWAVRRDAGDSTRAERASTRERLVALSRVWKVALLFVLVLGGIYSGWFTATEAGGVGAAGALLLALAGRLNRDALLHAFAETVKTTAMLFAMIIGASIFKEFINYSGAHTTILELVDASSVAPFLAILCICLVYVILGCVLDSLAMILLTLPMFFPIVVGLGYDPVWFGILVVILVELGLITPPIGMNLFIVRAIAPQIPLGQIMRGIVPFVVADIGRVTLLALIPALSLFLPNLLFN